MVSTLCAMTGLKVLALEMPIRQQKDQVSRALEHIGFLKNKFPNVIVSVCENRVVGAEKLLNLSNEVIPDVVLLDDAFQHRRITAGINILLYSPYLRF